MRDTAQCAGRIRKEVRMWLEQFGQTDERVFYAFCAAAFVILVLALAGMFSGCCLDDPSPGRSLSFFVNFSSMMITLTVLIHGIKTSWASKEIFSYLCKIYLAPVLHGYSMLTGCLLIKLGASIVAFRPKQVKTYREYTATLGILAIQLVAGAMAIVWVVLYTPTLYVKPDGGTTNMQSQNKSSLTYECRGRSLDGSSDWIQFLWRIMSSVYFGLFLFIAIIELPVLLANYRRIPLAYRPSILAYIAIILNTLICILVAMLVWFIYMPPDDFESTFMFAIVGGLELYVAFFANVAVLFGKHQTSKKCQQRKTEETLYKYLAPGASRIEDFPKHAIATMSPHSQV